MKYLFLATLVFALTRCAPTNPIKIAGYDVSNDDEIKYTEIPCFTPRIIHGSDTFEERRVLDAYRLHENQGYLVRFVNGKGKDKSQYLVEMDTACQVTRVATVLPAEDK
jgi:hypothetical protein